MIPVEHAILREDKILCDKCYREKYEAASTKKKTE
jgi:hypothetical protein